MSAADTSPRRARPLCGGARARLAVTLALVGCSAVGLSACRTVPGSDQAKKAAGDGEAVAVVATPAPPAATPVATAVPVPTATTPTDAVPTSDDVVATTPGGATTPRDASSGATTPAETTPAGDVSATSPGETPFPAQPRKLVVDNPWLVVGRAFVVDTTAPRGTTTGLTGYQLVFRTRGDFRGVRAGTALDDPRHYKIGAILVPELPAYLPSAAANLRLGDRNKSNGRYCWIATLGKQGTPGKIVFPARANGIAMAVEFDLHGAPVQRRTAPVFVRTKAGEQPSALQDKLGCHLNYF